MVGSLMGSELIAMQVAFETLGAQIIAVLIGAPFFVVANVILLVGTLKSEYDASNWWYRAYSFYDETKVGKFLILLCLFLPAILIFVFISLAFPTEVFSAIYFASCPWALCPAIPFVDLWASRQPPKNAESESIGDLSDPQE